MGCPGDAECGLGQVGCEERDREIQNDFAKYCANIIKYHFLIVGFVAKEDPFPFRSQEVSSPLKRAFKPVADSGLPGVWIIPELGSYRFGGETSSW